MWMTGFKRNTISNKGTQPMKNFRRNFLKLSAGACAAAAGLLQTGAAWAAPWNKAGFESKAAVDAQNSLGASNLIDSKDITKPGVYSVEYQDAEIQIQGCAGYAQARSYTVVEIIGDHYSKTTLYGAPFSIG